MVRLKALNVEQILLNHLCTSHQIYFFTSQRFTMLSSYTDEKDERALSAGPLEQEHFLASPTLRYTNKRTVPNATNPTIVIFISLSLCPCLLLVYSMEHSPN
jgi:hypothetical protein